MRKLLIFIAVVAIVVYGALQITNKLESKRIMKFQARQSIKSQKYV